MKEEPIRKRMTEALRDSATTNEHKRWIEEALRTNLLETTKQTGRQYFLFLAFAALFSVLAASDVSEVSVGGVKIGRSNPAVLLLPVLAAFAFYRAVCLFLFQDLVEKALDAFYQEALKPLYSNDISDFLTYPNFVQVENTFHNILKMPGSRHSEMYVILVGVLALVIPVAWLGFATYWIFTDFSIGIGWTLATLVLAWLWAVRALLLVVQTWRY